MSCPINTLLSQGKAFEALSDRDQLILFAYYFQHISGGTASPDQSFFALSERDQWIIIATLLGITGNSIIVPSTNTPDPSAMLLSAKDVQGASDYDQYNASVQQCCNVP